MQVSMNISNFCR